MHQNLSRQKSVSVSLIRRLTARSLLPLLLLMRGVGSHRGNPSLQSSSKRLRLPHNPQAMCLALGFAALLTASFAWSAEFYVDSVNGNNTWTGTSPAFSGGTSGPWQSLSKIRDITLQAADAVYLRCGSVWREQLTVMGSGASGSPIKIESYGVCAEDGSNKPAILGSEDITGRVWTPYEQPNTAVSVYAVDMYIEGTVPTEYYQDVYQVFVNNDYTNFARYPNPTPTPTPDDPMAVNPYVLTAVGSFSADTTCNTFRSSSDKLYGTPDTVLGNLTLDQVVGSTINFRSALWQIDKRTITDYRQLNVNGITVDQFNWTTPSGYEVCAKSGYYLTNKLWMLDEPGEWYFDKATKKLYVGLAPGQMPGATNQIEAAVRPTGVDVAGKAFVTLRGIRLAKVNTGIHATSSQDIHVNAVSVSDTEYRAMNFQSTQRALIENSTIHRSAIDGIYAEQSPGITIRNNVITDTGNFGNPRKSIAAIEVGFLGTRTPETPITTVSGNTVRKSGYSGILVGERNAHVISNVVEDSCLVLDDCGAIYTGGLEFQVGLSDLIASDNLNPISVVTEDHEVTLVRNLGIISNNLVLRVPGSQFGAYADSGLIVGIYLDYYANKVTVADNTVRDAEIGLLIHDGADNVITNNTFYGTTGLGSVWMQEQIASQPNPVNIPHMHGNRFVGNRYMHFSEWNPQHVGFPTLEMLSQISDFDPKISAFDPKKFGSYSNNLYSLLYTDIVATQSYKDGTTRKVDLLSFNDWGEGNESDARAFDRFRIVRVRFINSVSNPNPLLANGTFNDGFGGWGTFDSDTTADAGRLWVQDCETGSSCLLYTNPTSTSAHLSGNSFTITAGKIYRVQFDICGQSDGMAVQVAVTRFIPYKLGIGLNQNLKLSRECQTHNFVFTGQDDAVNNSARLDLILLPTNPSPNGFYLDNVLVEEVRAVVNNQTDVTDILINREANPLAMECPYGIGARCDQSYRLVDAGADSAPIQWPLTLPAKSSEIIVWDNAENPWRDSDKDGVVDNLDSCSDTHAGALVDKDGCAYSQRHPSDLAIQSVVATPSSVTVGDEIVFTVNLSNTGNTTTHGVKVTNELPPALQFVPSPGCSLSGSTVTCKVVNVVNMKVVNDMAPGATASLDIYLTAVAAGTIDNTVSVSGNENDSNTENNSRSTTVTIAPNMPDLSVASLSAVLSGDEISINDTIYNSGTATTKQFYVGYYLSTDNVFNADDSLFCQRNIAGIGQNASESVTGTPCPVPDVSAGNYYVFAFVDTNRAPFSAQIAESDENNNTKAAAQTISIVPRIDVGVTMAANPVGPVLPGDVVTFTATVTNHGNTPVTNVFILLASTPNAFCTLPVSDLEPGDSTSCSVEGSRSSPGNLIRNLQLGYTGDNQDGRQENNIASSIVQVQGLVTLNKPVTAGGTVTLRTANSEMACDTSCTNISARYDAGQFVQLVAEANPGYDFIRWEGDCNGEADCSLTINSNKTVTANFELAQPVLSVSLDAPTTSVMTDVPFSYSVTVSNTGGVAATGVNATITLPTGVTGNAPGCIGTSTLSCNLDTLANQASTSITVTATAKAEPIFNPTAIEVFQVSAMASVAVSSTNANPASDTAITGIVLACNGQTVTIRGTSGNNGSASGAVFGTDAGDVMHGLGGNDYYVGKKGNDVICGGSGNDILKGGVGDDALFGGPNRDGMYGENGTDICKDPDPLGDYDNDDIICEVVVRGYNQ